MRLRRCLDLRRHARRVGGGYLMSFSNFRSCHSHSFGGTYNELVPGEKLGFADQFDDLNLPGAMNVSGTLRKVRCGAELSIGQEGMPAAIPVEMCCRGGQESRNQLTAVVEPEIPG